MARATCSIVIPTRNCRQYLPASLGSVTLQKRDDLEVVLVDDGSTDGTGDWLRAQTFDGFKLTVLDTGGVGPSRARNRAVEAAEGKLIAFLDADDIWLPGKLDAQIAYHRAHPETGFSFTDYHHVRPDGSSLGNCFEFWREAWTDADDDAYFDVADAEARLLATNLVGTSTVVADRAVFEKVGGFCCKALSAEDWQLWLNMAAVAPVACSTAVTMTYLVRPNSLTANRGSRIKAIESTIDSYEHRTEPSFRHALRIARSRLDIARAEAAREQGHPLQAAVAHISAFTKNPSWRTGRAIGSDLLASALKPAAVPARS